MRSVQTILKSYTKSRHRAVLALLSAACAIPIAAVMFVLSRVLLADPSAQGPFTLLAAGLTTVAVVAVLATVMDFMTVSTDDLAALPDDLRAPVDSWLRSSSGRPLDWNALRELAEKAADEASAAAALRQAELALGEQRAAMSAPALTKQSQS